MAELVKSDFLKKVEFYIETLEAFIDKDELVALNLKETHDFLTDQGFREDFITSIQADMMASPDHWKIWLAFIANFTAIWLIKRNIGPIAVSEVMQTTLGYHYTKNIRLRNERVLGGKDPQEPPDPEAEFYS